MADRAPHADRHAGRDHDGDNQVDDPLAARREGERDLRPLTATCTALTTDSVGAGWIRATGRRYLRLREMPRVETIIDRSNLTILLERGYERLAGFLAAVPVRARFRIFLRCGTCRPY